MELIKQLWRGDVSLVRTYWGFGVFASILFKILENVLENYFFKIVSTSYGTSLIYAVAGLTYIYFSFIFIAIWRSATKYNGPSVWSVLAKFVVFMSAIILIGRSIELFEGSSNLKGSDLNEIAMLFNKNLPVMVDNATRLYKVSAKTKQLTFHYQIINRSASHFDQTTFTSDIRNNLLQKVCAEDQMRVMYQQGITTIYSYIDNNNLPIADITITSADCGF
jgi:hypothetical protein